MKSAGQLLKLMSLTILCCASTVAMACKMTPLAASAQKMTAIVDYITQHVSQQGEITSIRQLNPLSSHYIVKTTATEMSSQRTIYEATIQPDCKVSVQVMS